MKKLIFKISLLSFLIFENAYGGNISTQQINKHTIQQENTLKFEFDYAGNSFIKEDDLKALKNNEVIQIDLIYTQFHRAEDFDQTALNNKRIEALKSKYPILNKESIKWNLIEQTGATNFNEAQDYFHGFVIHFGKSLKYNQLSKSLVGIQREFNTYKMDENGGEITYSSGSKITIQPNSVTYPDGTPVKGDFTIKYREFRNQAEIALSGIPMTFEGQNFNSVGMYELRGEKDGKELKLNKPANVDFQCTKGDAGVGFYQLNENDSEWEKVKEITPVLPHNLVKKEVARPINHGNWTSYTTGILVKPHDSIFSVEFDQYRWNSLNKAMDTDSTITIVEKIRESRTILVDSINIESINKSIAGVKIPLPYHLLGGPNNRVDGSLLAEGADKGHTYPSIVKGLNSSSFGVYNCDQVFRMNNKITLMANYVDENGNEIPKKHVMCVIDLDYNGSFSFHPNSVTLNEKGNNVLLLFTEDRKVYVLSKEAFKNLDLSNPQQRIFMEDMTDELSSPEALKAYLEI